MAAEEKQQWPPVQPYDFGQGEPETTTQPIAPSAPAESTGLESYDKVTSQGMPDNPTGVQDVVDRGVVNVANPSASTDTDHETPGLSPEQQQRVDATAGTDRQIKTIQDWMDAEENRPETPEERQKRERREKSKRIISAVSDGISALSNLFFTSRYAPNMYNHEDGAMNAVDKRLEKLKGEREKKHDQYLNFALKLGDLENQRAATLRELEAQQEKRKLAREKAQREAEAHGWLAALQPDKQREQKGKADKATQEAITAKAIADAAPELQEAKLATEKARKGSLDASAANSYASAGAHNRSNRLEYSAWDEYGREHKFEDAEAAEKFARQHGTWQEENVTETTNTQTQRSPQSPVQTRKSSKTKKGGYPARPRKKTNVNWK